MKCARKTSWCCSLLAVRQLPTAMCTQNAREPADTISVITQLLHAAGKRFPTDFCSLQHLPPSSQASSLPTKSFDCLLAYTTNIPVWQVGRLQVVRPTFPRSIQFLLRRCTSRLYFHFLFPPVCHSLTHTVKHNLYIIHLPYYGGVNKNSIPYLFTLLFNI